jgi:hypothetical protein
VGVHGSVLLRVQRLTHRGAPPPQETKEQNKEKTEKKAADRTADDLEPENKETFDPEQTYHKGQFALR